MAACRKVTIASFAQGNGQSCAPEPVVTYGAGQNFEFPNLISSIHYLVNNSKKNEKLKGVPFMAIVRLFGASEVHTLNFKTFKPQKTFLVGAVSLPFAGDSFENHLILRQIAVY